MSTAVNFSGNVIGAPSPRFPTNLTMNQQQIGGVVCAAKTLTSGGLFRCQKPDGSYTCLTWLNFYAQCLPGQFNCNTKSSAFVPVITVCNQSLFL